MLMIMLESFYRIISGKRVLKSLFFVLLIFSTILLVGCSNTKSSEKSNDQVTIVGGNNNNQLAELMSRDSDGDGLSDYLEKHEWKTDPENPDTDGDGYSDGQEINSLHSPGIPAKNDKSTGGSLEELRNIDPENSDIDEGRFFGMARLTHDPSWCRKIKYEADQDLSPGKWERGACFKNLALYLGDSNLCAEIIPSIGPNDQETECYYNVAVATLDDGYCEKLPDSDRSGRNKFECYKSIAVTSGDLTICDNLNDDQLEYCRQWVDMDHNPEKLQLTVDMRLADEQIKADILSVRALAATYYNKNNDYSGLVFPSHFQIPDCSEDDEYHLDISSDGKSFVVWADLCLQDDNFCIDSNGYRGVTRVSWWKGAVGCR